MGNVCVGPNVGGNGFLQSITSVFKKNPPPEGRLPAPNADKDNKSTENAGPDSSRDSDAPKQVQSTPPELMKIPSDEKPSPPEAERPAKPEKPTHVKRVSSMGLRIETVLGRKTENIKDFYSLGRKLGQGQFGTTYYCLEKSTGKEFACKSILKRKLNTQEDIDDVRREIQIMHHLAGHPNVIQIIDAYEDAVAVHVIMELCAGGELFDRIIQRGHYTEKKAAELARVIVGVVEAFHTMGVMHRDLKPENFLFVGQEEESQLKTIDFGLSVFFRPGETFTDVVGSPYYVAPEVLRKFYGQECDVWSAGVIIYILLSGVPPFWDETELGIFDQVLKGELDLVSEPWPSISASAKDLLRKMLVRDPKKRLSAREVLCHPWFQTEGFALEKPLDSVVLTRLKQFSARTKLKKLAIRIIAETLSEDEIAGLKEMFKMIDADNSGQITFEEMKVGLERVGVSMKDSEINRIMQSVDFDNSGTIDYGEFVAAMIQENKVQQEDRLYTAFSYFDKDNSGYITRDELQQACQHFGLQDVQLDDIIAEVDQDNDGRIDYNEFVAMMQDCGVVEH
ncbi:calcium-dependent protein kinase 20-like [Neltuma alba]|uniref:calcium-dependent protein kinase 20-like n=1 Tax=Neltuma alba TaxID=207710 RepID=UPI0010A3FEE1|nr:calcium-dependent protein kinase 20-like [Prosopis alba]